MIEWKVYDPANPPPIDRTYLVVIEPPHGDERYMSVAKIEFHYNKAYFYEIMDGTSLYVVTHYAEINLPD